MVLVRFIRRTVLDGMTRLGTQYKAPQYLHRVVEPGARLVVDNVVVHRGDTNTLIFDHAEFRCRVPLSCARVFVRSDVYVAVSGVS